jgi:uncharacterized membrane protein
MQPHIAIIGVWVKVMGALRRRAHRINNSVTGKHFTMVYRVVALRCLLFLSSTAGAASPTQNLIPDAEEFVSLTVPTQFFVVVSSILEKAGEENERDQEVVHLYSELIQITQSRAPE